MATISDSARISGLASGLDVKSIVDGLTKGTQTKIEQAKQDLQIQEWKRDAYQDITDALYSFQNTYCGSSNTSMLSVNDLTKLSASSSSGYVTVSATDKSNTENVYISDIISLASAAKVTSSSTVSANPTLTANASTLSGLSGKSFNVSLDGITKTLTFSNRTYSTADDAGTELQSLLDNAFGSGRVTVSTTGDVISLGAANSEIVINNSGKTGSEVSDILSFTPGESNRLKLSSAIGGSNLALSPGSTFAFTVNGVGFSFTSSNSIQDIINKVNSSDAGVVMTYSKTSDTFTFTSTDTGSASAVKLADTEGSFIASAIGTGTYTNGTDAVIKVGLNGNTDEASLVTLTRSSNTFDIDGTTYTLTGKAPGNTAEGVSVTVGLDADATAKKITSFISAYNDLLKTISDKLYEKVYKGYSPLTDDQKKDMTDKEIEAWTDKAKSGLLNNDPNLEAIYNQLRSAMTDAVTDPNGNNMKISLASIGISTQSYSSKGNLSIDQGKLLNALKSDPASVLALLTQSSDITYSHYLTNARSAERYHESGILWRVNDIVKSNLSTVGNTGALVLLVGSPSKGYSGQTTYSKKINTAQEKVDTLLKKLNDEEDAYWKKYTALETAMSKLNSMSGYLTGMFSGK